MEVLAYLPSENKSTFLSAEKTIHTDHGKMYKVTTQTGHSIIVTDDHSLATVGRDDNLFSPLPPVDAVGKLVPIMQKIKFESGELTEDEWLHFISLLDSAQPFKVQEYMLRLNEAFLYSLFMAQLHRTQWIFTAASDYELQLFLILTAKVGFVVTINGMQVEVNLNSSGKVPEEGRLISRMKASLTNVYRNLPYTWAEVISVEEVEREDTTYDFDVPTFPLFIANGILVYDTMQVHVPITEGARIEALNKMMPSKNLFSPRTLEPMMLPQQESVYGLYEASKPSAAKPIAYTDIAKMRQDIEANHIKPNQPVTYKGKKTTAGLAVANEVLPEKLRDYNVIWNKSFMSKVMTAVGKDHAAQYTKIADELKDLGAMYAYHLAASFTLQDFDLHELKKERDAQFKDIKKGLANAKTYEEKVTLLRKAQGISQSLTDKATHNAFNKWAYSGSRGSKSQVMQIISSPTVVSDPRDRIIPFLISKSYNEGLSPAEYWASSYGTRKGTVSAKLSVAPGGALAKELIGNVADIVVTTRDCGTKDGITLDINDRKNIIGRYQAGTNKLIDSHVLEALIKSKATTVKVRSPIKCHAAKGVCQLCFGLNENGHPVEVGENVGIVAAHAITEPLTQMGLSSKHTAGTADDDEKYGLNVVEKFFKMPNQYSGAALIASTSGPVTKMESAPAGGTMIYIGNKKHLAMPGRKIFIKPGDEVQAGDILTGGIPNLAKVIPHKGIDQGREMFVHHANDIYNKAGAPSVKRNFEVVARGMINYVRIDDPGDFDHLVEGDIVDYNAILGEIKNHPDKRPPKFSAVQRGSTYAAQEKPDWLANFGFKYLKRNLIENAALGSESDLHGYHPIPAFVAGAEFGKGKDGKY